MITIMVVDDDPSLLRMVQIYLNDFPAELKLMKNGRSALKELEQSGCDLIVTDLQMPEIDGLTLIRQVRGMNKTIPIIVLSAYGMENLSREALDAGADVMLEKPFNRDALKSAICKQLDLAVTPAHPPRHG